MKPAILREMNRVICASCGVKVLPYEIMRSGSLETGYREICNQCFNTEVAKADGLTRFEHVKFAPVPIEDCTGASHLFYFRVRLFGIGVAIDAFELRKGYPFGYQFQIIADPEDDLMVVLGQLIEKIRRALSVKHITTGDFGWRIADHRVVRAVIQSDCRRGASLPVLAIDGREFSWHEFGRMLMTYEGWQLKLEIHDQSEEI